VEEVRIKLLKHQHQFLTSKAQNTVIVGGFRSGKSFSGVCKTVDKLIEGYKQSNGTPLDVAYYLPTYRDVKMIAYPEFKKQLQLKNIGYSLNQTDAILRTEYGSVFFRSMEEPSSIMGFSVHYSLIDEIDRVHRNKVQEAFDNILARNSAITQNEYNSTDFVSTPEGYGFLYHFWNDNKDNPKVQLIKASTRNNPYIHKSYIESLEDKYDSKKLQAYIEGDFVNLTAGTVYHAFNRKYHNTNAEVKPKETLYFGMDFNIEKMACVVFVIRKGIIYAVDEFTNVYDTFQMIDLIKEKYDKHPKIIFPDASGNNRKTAGVSDIQALKRARFLVLALKKNPPIKDRVNYKNLVFQKEKLFVNVKNCPTYTEALEQHAYDKNGVPDKTTGHDHVNDAGGYGIYGIVKKKKLISL